MEETNYDRLAHHEQAVPESKAETLEVSETDGKAGEKTATPTSPVDAEIGQVLYPRKTYWQKLGIKDKKRPNRLIDVAWASFKGFSYPSVVYGG